MERKFYTDDFERLLKEKSDEFRMYPSKRVWSSIYNDLHPGRKWPSVAVSLLLVSALFITGYWNSNNNSSKTAIAATSNIQYSSDKLTGENNNYGSNSIVTATSANNNIKEAVTKNTSSAAVNAPDNNTAVISMQKHNSKTGAAKNTNSGVPYRGTFAAAKTNPAAVNTSYTANNYAKENNPGITIAKNDLGSVVNENNNTIAVVLPATAVAEEGSNDAGKTQNSGNENNSTAPELSNTATTELNTAFTSPVNKSGENSTINNLNKELITEKPVTTASAVAVKKAISAEDKAWMDDYAMYNKSNRKKWKDRFSKEFYITPGAGFRTLSNNSNFDAAATNALAAPVVNNSSINDVLHQKAGITMEAGIGLVYFLSKKIRLKAGLQANYSSYVINAQETNHPVLTTLSLNDINTGYPYMASRTAILANSPVYNPAKVHNTTYQLALPVGFAVKLAGNDKLEWYAGASIQPTYVINGKANVISADRKYYVSDPSLLRHWSLNSGVETYLSYNLNGFNLQVGPQFRYQLTSTYSTQYTLSENLYNAGLKIGILKNF